MLRLGKFEEIKGPGLRWNPPIIDAWEIVDVVRVRPHRHDALMLTKDENIVDVTVSIHHSYCIQLNWLSLEHDAIFSYLF